MNRPCIHEAHDQYPLISTKLADAINEVWEKAYPGSQPVFDDKALITRVRSLADDRECWAFNSRVLQKLVNELEVKYNGTRQEVQAVPAPPPAG